MGWPLVRVTATAVALLSGGWLIRRLVARLPLACERMMQQMPASLPPNRVVIDLARVREQNDESLRLLTEYLAELSERQGPGEAEPTGVAGRDRKTT